MEIIVFDEEEYGVQTCDKCAKEMKPGSVYTRDFNGETMCGDCIAMLDKEGKWAEILDAAGFYDIYEVLEGLSALFDA